VLDLWFNGWFFFWFNCGGLNSTFKLKLNC
jgi:hypothetical protein